MRLLLLVGHIYGALAAQALAQNEKICDADMAPCGDWSVPCCHNYAQICDYTTRDPMTGSGTCRDLVCREDSVQVSGVPVWSQGFVDYDLNGVYERVKTNDYASYERKVGDRTFVWYPYAAGSIQNGWTLYCKECGFLWLIYTTAGVQLDITAIPKDSWKFQGNGGYELCAEPRQNGAACWVGSLDLSKIGISCGRLPPDGDTCTGGEILPHEVRRW